MILVTVGMHSQGFDRLIKKMDELAGKTNEEVIMQIGSSSYMPKNAKYFFFKDSQDMQALIKKARLVVCHGGAGTILTVMDENVPLVAVPRLKKYHEAIDDHQIELVEYLAKDGTITAVYDFEALSSVLDETFNTSSVTIKKDNTLAGAIKVYLTTLTG